MRSVLSIILIYSLAITSVFAQSVNPNDTLKIGNKSSSSDKGITFDTNDGVNNKKLLVEKISKKLKWDGNSVQIGDGSSSSDKELVIAGALKSLKYNGTTGEFEFNDDLKLSGELKSDILRAINTEVAVKSLLRAEQGIKVGTGSNEIRVNAGNLEFSNDGVLYKKFGTGTGNGGSSGISILENASFEDGITTGWTSSGGTFSQETYTNSVEGSTKYARFVATGAGQYFETTLKAIPDNFSGGCQADFKKVNVSTNDLFKVEVLDSSANVLSTGNVKLSSWVKFPTINFTCPTAGTQIKLRVTSLSAGTIEVDDAYLGSNQNLVNIAQAKLIGEATYTSGTTFSTTSGTFVTVTSASQVVSYSGVSAPTTTNAIGVTIPIMQQGTYVIEANGFTGGDGGGVNNALPTYSFGSSDIPTATTCGLVSSTGATSGASSTSASGSLRCVYNAATSLTSKEFYLKLRTGAGGTVNLGINPGAKISVWYFPSSAETAVSTDQASWFIDANIGGANPSLGTANVSSYTEIANSSLDLVLNPGSAPAKIPCSATNPATGLTCATGNESVGINFIPPYTGTFEVCTQFSWEGVSTTGGNLNVAFQNVLTANSAQTIIEEGKERASAQINGLQYNQTKPFRVCGYFTFNDTSEKTVRLMYEQAQGPSSSSLVMADRSATVGQRDIHITVRPVLSAYNRPILTGDQVITPGSVNPVIYSGTVSLTTGAVSNPVGSLINGNCSIAASVATCNFISGKFLNPPNCTFSTNNNSTAISNYNNAFPTTSGFAVKSINSATGAGTSNDFQFICHGIKP